MDENVAPVTDTEGEVVELWPSAEDFTAWVLATISAIESVDPDANMHWCTQWWDHPEAVDRLRALHIHQLTAMPTTEDPGGFLSSWWVDHWDRHAAVLFSKNGPFGQCRDGHQRKLALEVEAPPEEWQP